MVAEFLALFQPLFEDFAKSRGEAQLTLFGAGAWLVDMSLAAGDKSLLHQPQKVEYFRREMQRLNAPKGVLDALNELGQLAAKREMTDGDVSNILKLVKDVQTILT